MFGNPFGNLNNKFLIHYDPKSISLTLIDQQLTAHDFTLLKPLLFKQQQLTQLCISIMNCDDFDNPCLTILSESLPPSIQQLTLDFSGCHSLGSDSIIDLLRRVSTMELLRLHLDLGEIGEVDDTIMKGLAIVLEEQKKLRYLYLDLYDNFGISAEGLELLAGSIEELKELESISLDFSAIDNLSEDSLELLFESLNCKRVTDFRFIIAGIDSIGGGSFFKLAGKLKDFDKIQKLNLKISSFMGFSQEAISEIIKSISHLPKLTSLTLNLSDMQLTQQTLTLLNLPKSVTQLDLDISCNDCLTDNSSIFLSHSLPPQLCCLTLNLDICSQITDKSILQLLLKSLQNKNLRRLSLKDRKLANITEVLRHIPISRLRRVELQVDSHLKPILNRLNFYLIRRFFLTQVIYKLHRDFSQNTIEQILSYV